MAWLIPTVHPAAVLRGGRPISDVIAADIGKAWRIAHEGPNLEEHIIHVIPGNPVGLEVAFEHAIKWMRHWRSVGAQVGVDVETSAVEFYSCQLYSIAIGEAASSVAVTFTLKDFHTLPETMEAALVSELKALLAEPSVTKVFHNAPFDMAVLYRKDLQVGGKILDTQGLHHLIQPDIPHDLGWVGHTYLDVEPWKLDHESGKMANTKDPIKLLIYNARDALYTAKLVNPMCEAVHARGMSSELISWQSEFAQLATEMEIVGLPINMVKRRAMADELVAKLNHTRHRLREFLGWPDFNPMSDIHRREALFGPKYATAPWNLGLQSTKRTKKTGKESTSYKAIIDHLEHPFVKALADYIESQHVYATLYRDGSRRNEKGEIEAAGAFEQNIFDGRLYLKWRPNTLASTRYGSSPNGQNLRLVDRAFIEAGEGRRLVAADKDQLELRIVAGMAGVPELLEEMRKPDGDPHWLATVAIYGDALFQKPKEQQKTLRNITKNVVYASLYMAGVETVWRTVRERKQLPADLRAKMTLDVVRHVHTSYFMRYMEITRYNESLIRSATLNGYLEIPPLGRRRYCPVRPIPATEMVNWRTQCLGADFVTCEMVEIQRELKKRFHGTAYMILHGHDQAVVECREQDAEEVKGIFSKYFCNTRLDGPAGPVYLTAKPKIGKDLKEVK